MAEPTTTASAMPAISPACSGVLTPNPTASGKLRGLANARHRGRHLAGVEILGAGDAGDGDIIEKTAGAVQDGDEPRGIGGGRGQADDIQALRLGRQAQHIIFFRRQIHHDQAIRAGRRRVTA